MQKHTAVYLSYLVRFWRSGSDPRAVWRASIESPMNGERQSFARLQDLFDFIENTIDEIENQDSERDGKHTAANGSA